MKTLREKIGAWGENIAANFLIKNGYTIVEKNKRYRFGEIDIVAEQNSVLSFVEVKTRMAHSWLSAEFATNTKKIKRLERAAHIFCLQKGVDLNYTSVIYEHISVYIYVHTKRVRISKYNLSYFL